MKIQFSGVTAQVHGGRTWRPSLQPPLPISGRINLVPLSTCFLFFHFQWSSPYDHLSPCGCCADYRSFTIVRCLITICVQNRVPRSQIGFILPCCHILRMKHTTDSKEQCVVRELSSFRSHLLFRWKGKQQRLSAGSADSNNSLVQRFSPFHDVLKPHLQSPFSSYEAVEWIREFFLGNALRTFLFLINLNVS